MEKDFNRWNEKKKKIHNRVNSPFFHEREIWWCSLGLNIGFEQDGAGEEYYRPVLILKGMSRQTCFVIPLTASDKCHHLRPPIGIIEGKEAHALLSQTRLIDAKRLIRKMTYLDAEIFERIKKAAKDML
ncbi:MAG: type II toxin-antitoxin system PemK/MazF family toxin [Candidatus Jacksonbacteria bacterium]|nr:type II toxin-antitoxin system PemK/MazF family toxin [Candidatus Jacksonbacteria bacterium]